MTVCRECDTLLWRPVLVCRRCGAQRPALPVGARVHPGMSYGARVIIVLLVSASTAGVVLLVDRVTLWLLTRGN